MKLRETILDKSYEAITFRNSVLLYKSGIVLKSWKETCIQIWNENWTKTLTGGNEGSNGQKGSEGRVHALALAAGLALAAAKAYSERER